MYFVGIDSGGTKCEAVVCDEEANIVGYCYNKVDDNKSKKNLDQFSAKGGYGRSLITIRNTFNEATKNLVKSETFIIVCDFTSANRAFLDADFNYEYYYCHEYEGVTGAVNIDDAYIVLSGTGAFATYRCDGEDLYFDGLGPNLGDYGGGYYIGLKAAKATAMSEWGSEYKTSIAPYINNKLIGQENNHYGRDIAHPFLDLASRSEVAAYSYIVNQEAQKGDKIAIEILKDAANALGNTVRCLVKNVRPNSKNLPLVCDGSILKNCPIYRDTFTEYCKKHIPNNEILYTPMSQGFGEVMVALLYKKPDIRNEFYKKLLKNFKFHFSQKNNFL